jgi:drug/metabolite transporter (DMT)-like permease
LSASWLIVLAGLLFSGMGVCVKYASATYAPGEIVFYRGLVGTLLMAAVARWAGGTVRTSVPSMHFWRSLSGVVSLCLWFYAISNLPLATAMTLNYMSSVWMALFLVGGAIALGRARVDGRLIAAVLVGFLGVVLILRPTIAEQQLWHGLMGLLSGVIAATAYLQVTALGRLGEPEYRIVFWFSAGSVGAGALTMLWTGAQPHTAAGLGWLLGVGVLATTAQMLMTRAYSRGRTLVNASLQYLAIGWATLFGVVLFDDKVGWLAGLGMLLVVGAGIAATRLRERAAPVPVADSTNAL